MYYMLGTRTIACVSRYDPTSAGWTSLLNASAKPTRLDSPMLFSYHVTRYAYNTLPCVIYFGQLNLRFVPPPPLFLIMKPNNSTRITGIRHIHTGRRVRQSRNEFFSNATESDGKRCLYCRVNYKHESRSTDNKCNSIVLSNRRTGSCNVISFVYNSGRNVALIKTKGICCLRRYISTKIPV